MDWNDFFERTRVAAKVESYSKLAPLLGITDGAIGHYRMGRRVPQVWVVADALRIQGHPEPEKQAIEIMKRAALTSPERTFWKRLAATAMALCLAVGFALPHKAQAAVTGFDNAHVVYIMRNAVSTLARFVGSAWQWLGLWLGSCLRPQSPAKDEIAA
nr:MAG TPA: helix turn helix protein [Inoviridae sp.]